MIWVRRLIAVLLGLIFIAFAMLFTVASRANATLLNEEFYVQQLDKADVYNFIYDKALPAALAEADTKSTDFPVNMKLIEGDVVGVMRQTFPPEWVQEQVEETIEEAIPYMLGDEDSFKITIPIKDRVVNAGDALKKTTREGKVVDILMDDVIIPRVTESLGDLEDLPFGLTLTEEDVEAAVRRIVDRKWLEEQVTATIDSAVPYLLSEKESFTVRLDVQSRAAPAGEAITDILKKGDLPDFVFSDVVDPEIDRQIGAELRLSYGISVTNQEVKSAVRQALPKAWVDQRVDEMVEATVAYLTRPNEKFMVAVPLAERKAAAVEIVGALSETKLRQRYDSLPVCTIAQVSQLNINRIAQEGLTCRIPGVSSSQLQQQAGVIVRIEAERQINQKLPDQWTFGEAELEAQIGEERFAAISYVRGALAQGFEYTSDNLREAMARNDFNGTDLQWDSMTPSAKQDFINRSSSVERISDVRGWVRDGIVLDHEKLREQIGEDDPDSLRGFDNFRDSIGTFRSVLWIGWLLIIVMLAAIGFIGGRSMVGRLVWPAVFLAIAGVALFVMAGPVYNSAVEPRLEEQLAESLEESEGFEALMTEKFGRMGITAAGDAISSVRNRGILFLGLAAGMVVMGVAPLRAMGVGKSKGKGEEGDGMGKKKGRKKGKG
ncbi:MAG: hypothetical protein FJ320_03295 [SAR202 cluster bacterium]|nr:hypothetical protein [SAR202 cluster bacterium]